MVQTMQNMNHWLLQGFKYETKSFFKKQKNKDYIQKGPGIYKLIPKTKWVENLWWSQNTPPRLWRRAVRQHSVSWRWTGREVSIHKLQVTFACVESSRSSQDYCGQSCGFLPFPRSQQGYMQFNSWWAAYNSSSLGANMTGGSGFPTRNNTGPLQRNTRMGRSLLPLPVDYLQQVSFQDYYPHHACSFSSKSKPWGDIKETNIKKRIFN